MVRFKKALKKKKNCRNFRSALLQLLSRGLLEVLRCNSSQLLASSNNTNAAHSPDNTFLGLAIEPKNETATGRKGTKPLLRDIALAYGKDGRHFMVTYLQREERVELNNKNKKKFRLRKNRFERMCAGGVWWVTSNLVKFSL